MAVQPVKTAHEKTLRKKTQESSGCGAGQYRQKKAVRSVKRGEAHIAADHEIGAVGKIDNTHQPEHQAEAGGKEKEQHAESDPVQYLRNGYGQCHRRLPSCIDLTGAPSKV